MKVLHILRSRPDDMVKFLVGQMTQGGGRQVPLYEGNVDYTRLLAEIFESDKVICWW